MGKYFRIKLTRWESWRRWCYRISGVPTRVVWGNNHGHCNSRNYLGSFFVSGLRFIVRTNWQYGSYYFFLCWWTFFERGPQSYWSTSSTEGTLYSSGVAQNGLATRRIIRPREVITIKLMFHTPMSLRCLSEYGLMKRLNQMWLTLTEIDALSGSAYGAPCTVSLTARGGERTRHAAWLCSLS